MPRTAGQGQMKLGRKKKPAEPAGRQRLRSLDSSGSSLRNSYAYHNRRSDYDQNVGRQADRPAESPHKRRFMVWAKASGLGGLLLLIVAVGSLISIISVSSTPKIVIPDVQRSALLRDHTEYEAAAQSILDQSVLNKNKLTINTKSVRNGLLKQYPELANVGVTMPLVAHKPVIHLEPEQPAIMLSTQSGQFIISDSGKALLMSGNAPDSARLQLPVVTDQSGLTVRQNEQVLPANQVTFMKEVLGQLKAKNVTVGNITLPQSTSELDVQINGQPYFVKFNLQRPASARQQAGTFIATQNQLKSQNIAPSKYIDVRVDGRAYYQ